jgi:hypothetical protein
LAKASKYSQEASPFPLSISILDWACACQLYSEWDLEKLKSNEDFLVRWHLLQTHYKIFDPIPVSFSGTTMQEYVYPCSGNSDNCLKYCAHQYKLYVTNFTKCEPCIQLGKAGIKGKQENRRANNQA